MIKHHEFWHPRLFEIPYYLTLGFYCLLNRISIKSLAKANYALDHGEIGIGSKYESQLVFKQDYFLPTILLKSSQSLEEKIQETKAFVQEYGYPAILKSDVGCVGKGICKLNNLQDIEAKIPLLLGDFILQKFTPFEHEYGIFFTRYRGQNKISGINKKHFPSVIGNGRDTISILARRHERYTHHWHAFLQSIDTSKIPKEGEEVRLSFIGSHTLGCKFTDDTHLVTPALERAVFDFFDDQPGYNFGRFDVKAESEEAFLAGDFVVIEVNGIASLPTNMFDPKFTLLEAYKIFLQHGKVLVAIAKEHQEKSMPLLSYKKIIQEVKDNQALLNKVHQRLKGEGENG